MRCDCVCVCVCSWTCVWRLWRGRWMRRRRRSTDWNTTRRNSRETWRSSRRPTNNSRVSSKHCAVRWGNIRMLATEINTLLLIWVQLWAPWCLLKYFITTEGMTSHSMCCSNRAMLFISLSKYTWHNVSFNILKIKYTLHITFHNKHIKEEPIVVWLACIHAGRIWATVVLSRSVHQTSKKSNWYNFSQTKTLTF